MVPARGVRIVVFVIQLLLLCALLFGCQPGVLRLRRWAIGVFHTSPPKGISGVVVYPIRRVRTGPRCRYANNEAHHHRGAADGLRRVSRSGDGHRSRPAHSPGYTWCPGQPPPAHGLGWDTNVCHTFYVVGSGAGNVPMVDVWGNPMNSFFWADSPPPPPTGPPPPPLPPRPAHCPPWNVIIGPSECGGL